MNVVKIDLLEVIKWIMIIIISLAIPGFFPIGLLLSLIVGLVYNGAPFVIGVSGGATGPRKKADQKQAGYGIGTPNFGKHKMLFENHCIRRMLFL